MANKRGLDEMDEGEEFRLDAPATMKGTDTATATAAPTATATAATAITKPDETRNVDEEEITEPKMSYTWTYWHARFTELNAYEDLPCPVETQGAHLISAPPSPKAVAPRHDPTTFPKDLSERLRRLVVRQAKRVNMYGEDFANEWPISRTPRPLAEEVGDARIRARRALLHLDSPSSSSDSEYETAWVRRMREARERRRQARAQAKTQAKAGAAAKMVETVAVAHIPAQTQPRPRTHQLSPGDDAETKSEQPAIDTIAHQTCKKRKASSTWIANQACKKRKEAPSPIAHQTGKKRKAPPTPISPPPKRVRV